VAKTSEVLEERDSLNLEGPLVRSNEPSPSTVWNLKTMGMSEDSLDSLGDYTQTDPSVLSEIDDSLVNFIPSYKEVLN
jgi:hypothetical protein